MDGLSSDFGDLGLSSDAREWKPPSSTAVPGAGGGGGGGGPQQHPTNLPHSHVPAQFQRQPRPPPPPGRDQQPLHVTSNLTPLGTASPARSVSSRSSGNNSGTGGGTTPNSNNGIPSTRGPSASSSPSATGSGAGSGGPGAARSGGKDTSASVASQSSAAGKSTGDNSTGKTPPGSLRGGERNDWEELESELNAATVKEYVPGRAWGDDKSRAGSVASSQGKNMTTGQNTPYSMASKICDERNALLLV